jgi:hypothetical protein
MVDGKRYDFFISIFFFFGLVGERGFLTEPTLPTNFIDKFATFPHTDFTNTNFTDFRPTPTLLTAIRFVM